MQHIPLPLVVTPAIVLTERPKLHLEFRSRLQSLDNSADADTQVGFKLAIRRHRACFCDAVSVGTLLADSPAVQGYHLQ